MMVNQHFSTESSMKPYTYSFCLVIGKLVLVYNSTSVFTGSNNLLKNGTPDCQPFLPSRDLPRQPSTPASLSDIQNPPFFTCQSMSMISHYLDPKDHNNRPSLMPSNESLKSLNLDLSPSSWLSRSPTPRKRSLFHSIATSKNYWRNSIC